MWRWKWVRVQSNYKLWWVWFSQPQSSDRFYHRLGREWDHNVAGGGREGTDNHDYVRVEL